jgi:hypothetical protein
MGMTLWVRTLSGRKIGGEEIDHTLMHDYAEELDELCKKLRLEPLSAFFDFTDLEYRLAANPAEDAPLDPESGLPYAIDAMKWFPTKRGLSVVQALEKKLRQRPELVDLETQDQALLLGELEDCATQLAPSAADKFHFAVIL